MKEKLPVALTAISCQQQEIIWPAQYLLLLNMNGEAVLEGNENAAVPAGRVVFLAPYSGCRVRMETGASALYAGIDQAFMEEMIGLPKKHCVLLDEAKSFETAEKLVQLFEQQQQAQRQSGENHALQSYSVLFELLSTLEPGITLQFAKLAGEGESRDVQLRQYVLEHYQEQIQLQDLADTFGLSRQHASTTFHKEVGMSFSDYLQSVRVSETVRLLMTTELNISEICQKSGFPNQKALHNAFRKEYGMNPREYRNAQLEKRQNQTEQERASGQSSGMLQNVSAMLKPYRMVYEKSGQQLHVRSDVPEMTEKHPVRPEIWRDILNIDTAFVCLNNTVQQELRSLQNALHFRYVRLGNIFNSEFTPYMPASGRHRMTFLFQALNFFREIGLTPMLALGDSYMVSQDFVMVNDGPYSIAKEDWLKMLENLIRVSVSNWGREWVSTWRFEFHMPEKLYGLADPEVFLDIFAESCRVVHRYLPDAAVGGPGMQMDKEHMPRWDAWFRFIRREKIRVDFITMELWGEYTRTRHTFGGQFHEERYAQSVGQLLNADAAVAIDRVRQVREKMDASGLTDSKLYVAAVGITKYQAKAAQLGGHCPAWLIRVISGLQGLADGIGCWKALNHEAEYPDEFQVLGVGCGILSRYGIRTPAWFAYEFLSRLMPYELLREQQCCVTGDGNGNYAVLIQNCKDYSDYFCRHFLEPEALEFTDKRCYVNQTALVQTLTFPPMEDGVAGMRVRQYLLGDHHGCPAYVLGQMGQIDMPTEEQMTYLAGQAVPYQFSYFLASGGRPEVSVTLQPNEVMLLILEKERPKFR